MPYLKRNFTYKDESRVLHVLKQGEFIEKLETLPDFVQKLLKQGNYLVEEKVVPSTVKLTEKKPLEVKLSEETTAQVIKLDINEKKESPKKENKGLLNTEVVEQQGKTHALNKTKANPTNRDSIEAVKGTDIKLADSPLLKPVEIKPVEIKKEVKADKKKASKEEDNYEKVSTKENAVLVKNNNVKPRPQGKKGKK